MTPEDYEREKRREQEMAVVLAAFMVLACIAEAVAVWFR